MTHQFDPDRAPDSEYEPGTLEHLVPGSHGRMLDPRRTPIRVISLRLETATFTCEVLAFEDRGTRWELPFESVASFQFERGGQRVAPAEVAALAAASARFQATLDIAPDASARARSLASLAALRQDADAWLEARSTFLAQGGALDFDSGRGDPRLWQDLRDYLEAKALWEMEDAFAAAFVSNPHAGELVLGHRIVLAELGLAPYRGRVVRDPGTFAGGWSRESRAEHVLARMAFVHALFERVGVHEVTVHRGVAGRPEDGRTPAGLVSASLRRDVAEAMLGPPGARVDGVVERLVVPSRQLFMTCCETEHLNRQYLEAEVVFLPGDLNT